MSMDLEAALAGLLESCDLDTYIQECGEKSPKSGGPFLKILFPRFSEDAPDIQAFAEFLWLQAINYVIPLRLRKQAKDEIAASSTGGNLSAASRLMQRTRKTFLEFNQKFPHRASEVGELLAYLIALRYLEAVQIASKMALKTNSNMPVYGLDGIHARFSGGVMTLYFLESKLAKTAASGFGDYVSSTGKFGANRKQYLLEYEIISNLSNLDALSQSDRDLALEYLDVYGAQKSQRVERSVGIICYTDEQL